MMTEFEYLKFLQENSVMNDTNMNESSFFKGIINVEKSSGQIRAEDQSRLEETHALKDLN